MKLYSSSLASKRFAAKPASAWSRGYTLKSNRQLSCACRLFTICNTQSYAADYMVYIEWKSKIIQFLKILEREMRNKSVNYRKLDREMQR